jgi:hypothetical protein
VWTRIMSVRNKFHSSASQELAGYCSPHAGSRKRLDTNRFDW